MQREWLARGLMIGTLIFIAIIAEPGGAEGDIMSKLDLHLDGSPVELSPSALRDGDEALVPLTAFCDAVGAEAKELEGTGVLAVCRDDLCIPLNASGDDTVSIEGETFVRLSAFGGPLGLVWKLNNGALTVTTGTEERLGFGIGSRPPGFTLPDLYTGESVSPADYLGKRAVFFMWASW